MFKRLLLLLLGLPGSVFAVDGVFEINQACALSGCFPGDEPGFPVRIENSGAYRLTGNLDVTSSLSPENVTAIAIATLGGTPPLDVTIDLNGFGILGPVACTGFPVTACSPLGGAGVGIRSDSDFTSHVRIMNGFIRGMGEFGIACPRNCSVIDVTIEQSGSTGFVNSNGHSTFVRCTAMRNGGSGFLVKGIVRDSTAAWNLGDGIGTTGDSQVLSSRSTRNGGNGIRCAGCLLLDSLSNSNEGVGVEFIGPAAFGRNLMSGNTAGEISGSAFAVDPNRCGAASC